LHEGRFSIGLNIREKELIQYLVTYFNLGYSSISKESESLNYVYLGKNSVSLQVVKHSHIMDIIIPNSPLAGVPPAGGGRPERGFLDKYPIQGKKSLDFFDFKKVAEMLKNKEHLTSEGFNKILDIKARMNEERL
jgi:hypothetical protein